MSISIIHHDHPRVRVPEFSVDGKIHTKLDDFELSSLLNRSHCLCAVGRAGSGKTSIMVSFLNSRHLFQKVFHHVWVIMPPTSRASLKNDPFKGLPPGQLIDDLTLASLTSVWESIQAASKLKETSLLILDDVQSRLKETAIEKLLIHMNSNRRHQRLSLWICAQNYVKIPKQFRVGITNLFLFSVSRVDMQQIHEELLEIGEPVWERACALFKRDKEKPGHEKQFLFIDTRDQRFFMGWDELRMPREDGLELTESDVDA